VNGPGNGHADTAMAIRKSVRRTSWVGGVSVGFSPWLYVAVILLVEYLVKWKGLGKDFEAVRPVLRAISLGTCAGAFPTAWAVQVLLARKVASRSDNLAQQATNLSAAGIVSLTVVHTPAVFGLLYYLIFADGRISLAMELWAFLTYLPMQWLVNRQIRALDHNLNDA